MRSMAGIFTLAAGIAWGASAMATVAPGANLQGERVEPLSRNPSEMLDDVYGSGTQPTTPHADEAESYGRDACGDLKAYVKRFEGRTPTPCLGVEGSSVFFQADPDGDIYACRGGDDLGVETDVDGEARPRKFDYCEHLQMK